MASQGSSRADFFDLTGEEDPTSNAEAIISQPSASAGPSQPRFGAPSVQNNAGRGTTQDGNETQDNSVLQIADDDSDVEMLDDAPVDEAVRQRNLENRRERLLARGIREEHGSGRQNDVVGHGRSDSVAEVIVISDGEDSADNEGLDRAMGGGDDDIFGEERRRQRRWNNWADDLEERLRHPNARRPSPDLFDFQFPPHLPTMPPPSPPRIRLGGGGIVSRDRPLPLPNNNNSGPSMHRRSVQLDGERLQGRVRAHLDGLVREEDAEYRNLDLPGRLRNAMGRLGDVFGALGWGIGGGADAGANDVAADGWGPPGWGADFRGRAGGWRRGGWRGRGRGFVDPFQNGPPSEEGEQPLNLPEAPEWKVSFTHPGKMPHGFTSDFAPVEPELIVLEDSDEESKNKKGKGKARRPIQTLESENKARQTLVLVCTKCKDPLLLGGETDEQRVYGLRCGHVLDGKCLWKIAKPPESQPHPSNPPKPGKGKARAGVQETQMTMDVDPSYKFTFVAPVENLAYATTPQNTSYHEDNDPIAAPVSSRAPLRRSGGQGRREVVPTPNPSARRTRRRTRQNALDGVRDELTPDPAQAASTSTSRLDLSDPFFPSPAMNPRRGRGGARGGRGSSTMRAGGRTKMRMVPKTKGRLKEEVFEWKCPVPGCGREHISVRLDMEGAKWKCDPDKGAVLMFL